MALTFQIRARCFARLALARRCQEGLPETMALAHESTRKRVWGHDRFRPTAGYLEPLMEQKRNEQTVAGNHFKDLWRARFGNMGLSLAQACGRRVAKPKETQVHNEHVNQCMSCPSLGVILLLVSSCFCLNKATYGAAAQCPKVRAGVASPFWDLTIPSKRLCSSWIRDWHTRNCLMLLRTRRFH